jgi:lipid A disaccharide synthetase
MPVRACHGALRLAMVAGEQSGDLLGSRALRALRRAMPG